MEEDLQRNYKCDPQERAGHARYRQEKNDLLPPFHHRGAVQLRPRYSQKYALRFRSIKLLLARSATFRYGR